MFQIIWLVFFTIRVKAIGQVIRQSDSIDQKGRNQKKQRTHHTFRNIMQPTITILKNIPRCAFWIRKTRIHTHTLPHQMPRRHENLPASQISKIHLDKVSGAWAWLWLVIFHGFLNGLGVEFTEVVQFLLSPRMKQSYSKFDQHLLYVALEHTRSTSEVKKSNPPQKNHRSLPELTARTWKWMVGIRLRCFLGWPVFRNKSSVLKIPGAWLQHQVLSTGGQVIDEVLATKRSLFDLPTPKKVQTISQVCRSLSHLMT